MAGQSRAYAQGILPTIFILCAAWVIWNGPSYIMAFGGYTDALAVRYRPAYCADYLALIGVPLGLASAILAVLVLVMKFEPTLLWDPLSFGEGLLTRKFGSRPLNILAQKIYGLLTDYVLISIPLFIFMAALLERSGIAKDMYNSLNIWLARVRGGIVIVTSVMARCPVS